MAYSEHQANTCMLPYMMGTKQARQAFLFNTPGPHHNEVKQLRRDLSMAHHKIQELQHQLRNTVIRRLSWCKRTTDEITTRG
jgi:hypothetical protein